MTIKAIEIMDKVAETLSVPKRWTRESCSIDAEGNSLRDGLDFLKNTAQWSLADAVLWHCFRMPAAEEDFSSTIHSCEWALVKAIYGDSPMPEVSKWGKAILSYNGDPARVHTEVVDLIAEARKILCLQVAQFGC